jgi:uncharacterized protein YkwD
MPVRGSSSHDARPNFRAKGFRMPRRLALAILPVAGFLCAFLLLSGGARADNVCTPDPGWGTLNTSFAAQVLTLINQHRATLGEGALTTDWALTDSAQWKSMNMSGLDYFDHTDDPIGRSVQQRLLDCGYPASSSGWGENIAYGYPTPASVVQAWLNSPGHRANIENASYRTTGIGVAANAAGAYYWTQEFGTVSSSGGPPTTTRSTTTRTTTTRTTTTGTTTTTRTTTTTPTTTTTGATTTHPTTTQPTVPRTARRAKISTPVAGHPRIERHRHFVVVKWSLKRHAGRPAHYLVLWRHRVVLRTERRTARITKRLHGRIRIVAVLPGGTRTPAVTASLPPRRGR